jgi:hypothetical protein
MFYADADWKKTCLSCWIESKNKPVTNTIIREADIEPEIIKKLLFLCHPDKHNNSVTSTEITKWLINKRNQNH